MTGLRYISFKVNSEQIDYTRKLVAHSLANHTVSNIWDGTDKESLTEELRFTGTLGEVLFADFYGLDRPERSFGAKDGQDHGQDFYLQIDGSRYVVDVKSMKRKTNIFYRDYVLNIPLSHVQKIDTKTDIYFHISIHNDHQIESEIVASFVGFVRKEDVLSGKVGTLYKSGTWRVRANGTKFRFNDDTYEILFSDLSEAFPRNLDRDLIGVTYKILR